MSAPLSQRCAAEAIEQFGDDLAALNRAFDKKVERMRPWLIERVNGIEFQDHLDTIAEAFRKLGDELCRECDEAEEAFDRLHAHPLEPGFRRIG